MKLRLGTRSSALARAQADGVAAALRRAGHEVEVAARRVAGDRGGGPADKSRWVSELDEALRAGEIDLAVHSAKDVPGDLAAGVRIAAVPVREDARDVLCGASSLAMLPIAARVGTASLRRAAALRAARQDLEPVAVSGNVDTRLARLAEGAYDALVLARAGLRRLGREEAEGTALDPDVMLPAPGQGALALCAREGDAQVASVLTALDDPRSHRALRAERAVGVALGASCRTPIGVLAEDAAGDFLRVRAFVGRPDGAVWLRDELTGPAGAPEALGEAVAARLRVAGAQELLAELEREAA